ncbi:carbohydrate ABC transporter permease [Microbacterium sp. LWS13-1.2]|uniref:Carbohydrate ABC transporter permease n=1 Tax=Microbacterium sp. LWS13-1.2 TaxID=3135264 RepID=A0AAU6SAS7_9MICO
MNYEPISFRVFRWVVLTFLGIFVIVPVYVMVTTALKPIEDVQGSFEWWPSNLTIQPFIDMWSSIPLALYFTNSVIVAVTATVFSVIIAIFAAYAISRYRFRARSSLYGSTLATQMLPGLLFMLPLFFIFVNLDRVLGINFFFQTLPGLIITYLTFTLPFSIWMLSGFFDGIPRDLDEAAKVDGANVVTTLFRIIIPVARPGIVAVAVYSFMTAWGEILFASQMTNAQTKVLSIGMQGYSSEVSVAWNQIMAASFTVSVPVVVVFLLLQRYIIAGLTSGSVK